MFQLKQQDLKFKSLNTRTENHGQGVKPALDMQVSWLTRNDALDMFNKELKAHFFMQKPPEDEEQGDLADQATEYSLLRFAECSSIKWDYKGAGYRMLIHRGISGEDNILVVDVKIDKFSFEFKKGGMVEISFKISCVPIKSAAGDLFEIQGTTITLDLEASEEDQNMSLFEESLEDEEEGFVA